VLREALYELYALLPIPHFNSSLEVRVVNEKNLQLDSVFVILLCCLLGLLVSSFFRLFAAIITSS